MRSAGILLFRNASHGLDVFLVHPGGPFFARKDDGVWSIPKGIVAPDEDALVAARREFEEETGQPLANCAPGEPLPLGEVRQASGKIVQAWACEGDWPSGAIFSSNTFSLEWPPRSGRHQDHPEVDRGEFFSAERARVKIHPSQVAFIDRLLDRLAGRSV